MHLHNVELLRQIQEFDSETRKASMIYKKVKESLSLIAKCIQLHDNVNEIKGLVGITMLNKVVGN
ncbi:YkoP family protein [Cytobacillus kochii]|uniref:YkoP family protein n=1 Tax=Cytobacillus kochii TaxID=859143 RepID=UPI003CCBB39E